MWPLLGYIIIKVQLTIVEQYIPIKVNKCKIFALNLWYFIRTDKIIFFQNNATNPDKYNRSGAISDAPQVRGGAICDALQVRSGAIVDAPSGEPEKCCIKNCYIVVSLNKVLIILMLGLLLEVH